MTERETNVHGYYREVFTKLLNINPTLAEEIQARPITVDEKITAIEVELDTLGTKADS